MRNFGSGCPGLAFVVALVAACGGGEAGGAASGGVAGVAAERVARTPTGVEVRLAPEPDPLVAGPVVFGIELAGAPSDSLPVTVDVVSPTMPMHGIVRVAAVPLGGNRYRAEAEIPMAGLWAVYVNLDDGGDAALFELEVPPADTLAHGHGPPADS